MIYILTGDIRSGKTTALKDWANDRDDVDGLLCPDAKDGKRFFLKVKVLEEFQLESRLLSGEAEFEVDSAKIVAIGSFYFFKSAFKKANNFLISFTSENENRYLIIDELGKLELKDQGLHLAAKRLISEFLKDDKQHLILVVRDYLVDGIVAHYRISEYQLLKKEDLKSLI